MNDVVREVRDDRGVVTLTLHRPEVRNAFDPRMMGAVAEAAARLAGDEGVRAVVLTGSGQAFSAGADLTWMADAADYTVDENVADARGFEAMLRAVAELPMPVLARVNGHAIAGASGLLACVDVAVAVRGAKFGFTEVQLGLVPAMVSAYVQPRIGVHHARRYLLTGELFDADRAVEIGLIQQACEPDELDEVFERLLGTVLAGGPAAQREVKRLIAALEHAPAPADTEELRVHSIARARVGDEAQHRLERFLHRPR